MSDSSDDERDDQFPGMGPAEAQMLMQILAAKQGMPSSMPSAFLLDDMFDEPYTQGEIEADPKKHILWAAENNKHDIVETLLREDGDLVHSVDEDGYTPLHRASYNGHLDMIKLLLANGADIHSRTTDGWQPFHSACRWDNVHAAKMLISAGADVHAVTNGNNTALHLAASHGEAEAMIKFLLSDTDIDVTIRNNGGDTAEQVAMRNSRLHKHFHVAQTEKTTPTVTEAASSSALAGDADSASPAKNKKLKVVIVPGNGGGNVYRANWYGWLHKTIGKTLNVECRLENMPDPVFARESIWLPFMENELQCDDCTIAVGHSSGSAAIMRYTESHQLYAAVLVSAYISDLGDETEAKSGYFSRPWNWSKIKKNCSKIIQFGSSDDPFLPWEEQKTVAENTAATFHQSDSDGHFMNSKFPQLMKVVTDLVRDFQRCRDHKL